VNSVINDCLVGKPMKKHLISITVLFLVLSISFVGVSDQKKQSTVDTDILETSAESCLLNSSWPMKCHDTYHTSQSPYNTRNTSTEKWRFYFSGGMDDSPTIDKDGTIYCKGAFDYLDRYLYAINPDGTEKWKYKTGGLILGSSPAIAEDGTIYFGAWDRYLYALYNNGTLKWRFPSYGDIYSSPAIAEDGTVYFGTMLSSCKIYAVYPNGTEKWSYSTENVITSDPAIGNDGTVYIGSQDYYLYALWPNGTLRWRFYTGDYIMGPPSIANDGTIYIASWDDYLYALYTTNGTMKWRQSIGVGAAVNPSIASDGTIYIGYNDLYAIYPNGTRRWTFDLGSQRHIQGSSPAISANGIIYVGVEIGESAGGEIIAINSDGTELWRKRIAEKWVTSSPSIAEDGTIYIGSTYDMSRGYLHAFGTVESNKPPSSPIITGETNGKVGNGYTYTFVSSDPENYPLKYYVEWGDGTNSGWTWEYNSNVKVNLSHIWSEKGTYIVRAKAMDISNNESDWGTLSVTMPYEPPHFQFLKWVLERFPNAFPILRYLFGFR
jgi:outer membrane protein assembly factor BamB